jgi:hypothetical protein
MCTDANSFLPQVFWEALRNAYSDAKELLRDACITSLARTAALRHVGDVMGITMLSVLQAVPSLTSDRVLRNTTTSSSYVAMKTISGPEGLQKGTGAKVATHVVVSGDRGDGHALTSRGVQESLGGARAASASGQILQEDAGRRSTSTDFFVFVLDHH